MRSSNDKFLLGGLGCGMALACLAAGYFAYIVQNLRVSPPPHPTRFDRPQGTVDPSSLTESTSAPFLFVPPTETILPSPHPPFDSPIPSPIPTYGSAIPPTGRIAFACFIEQIDQICLMNADGTNRVQLTEFQATSFYPSISPDGNTIYFSSKQSGGFEIYSLDINGENPRRLTSGIGSLYAPELSPNGDWIVFTNHGNGLWLMRPDGNDPHPLTDRDDIDPTWSPDGSMIAFASSRNGSRQLFVMKADGSNIRQVTDLDNMGGRSAWSPDGTKLAFYRGEFGNRNVYIVNVDGTGLFQLTSGGDNLGPSWSPDGNWIAFTSFRDGNNEIYIMHPDGTGVTRLTNNRLSDWQPRWGR